MFKHSSTIEKNIKDYASYVYQILLLDDRSFLMKVLAILLFILGLIGILIGIVLYGDIGTVCIIAALSAFLTGIGFFILSDKL